MNKKTKQQKPVTVVWDWKDQIDLDIVNKYLPKFQDPFLAEVETDGDWNAVVILERKDRKKAQAFYNAEQEEMSR